MEAKTFLMTMGIGLAAGAAVGLMVPKNSELHQTARKAVRSVEHAADKAAQMMQ